MAPWPHDRTVVFRLRRPFPYLPDASAGPGCNMPAIMAGAFGDKFTVQTGHRDYWQRPQDRRVASRPLRGAYLRGCGRSTTDRMGSSANWVGRSAASVRMHNAEPRRLSQNSTRPSEFGRRYQDRVLRDRTPLFFDGIGRSIENLENHRFGEGLDYGVTVLT
jgi:hypothetical protein